MDTGQRPVTLGPSLAPRSVAESLASFISRVLIEKSTACTVGVNMSFLKADDVDVVSVCCVPDDGTLGCSETLHVVLKEAHGRADG